jgi:hypothetical protein
METPVEYHEVSSALLQLTGVISSMDEISTFLLSKNPNKPNAARLICWFFKFNHLPPMAERWATSLYLKYQEYMQIIRLRIADPSRPLADLSPSSALSIECDIHRGVCAFNHMAESLDLTAESGPDVILRAHRVFAAINLSHDLSYTQGYDRYWFVSFSVCLDACSRFGLGNQFAEALSFHLTYSLLQLVRITTWLDHPTDTEHYFERMDMDMRVIAPQILGPLQLNHQGSVHFALRWQLLLFADEYEIRVLLVLWDNVFLRPHQEFSEFLFSLCIAHILQVPLAAPGEYMIEKIHNYRDWAVDKIIEDAITHMVLKRKQPRKSRHIIIVLLVAAMFILFVFHFVRRNRL